MAKRIGKGLLIVLGISLVVVLVGPFLVPFPALDGRAANEFADADSRFVDINGVTIHYKQYGRGEPTLILLHGTLATAFTWREVVEPLARAGTVIAYDRPAFGLSSRPMPGEWTGTSPYGHEAQAEMLVALMDALGIQRAILVGNSLGGEIAALAAQQCPERVAGLVLVAPVQAGHGVPGLLAALLSTPQMRRLGPLLLREKAADFGMRLYDDSWHDPARIDPRDVDEYSQMLQVENWDRGLWELSIAARPFESLSHYETITVPTLVMTGDDDRMLGTEENVRLADRIPGARLVVIPECGHVPQEECPEASVQNVTGFAASLDRP
jgi:pimeloyl-ACP methyl ester carboxylesterase